MEDGKLDTAMNSYVRSLVAQIGHLELADVHSATAISGAIGASCFNAPQKATLADAINTKAQSSTVALSMRNPKTQSLTAPNAYMTASDWNVICDSQTHLQAVTAVMHRMSHS